MADSDSELEFKLKYDVTSGIQGLASIIAKEGEHERAISKKVAAIREVSKATAELLQQNKQSHDLVGAFKKHEAELEQRLGKATIEEKNKILKKSQEVEQLIAGHQFDKQRTVLASEQLIAQTKERWASQDIAAMNRARSARTFMLRSAKSDGDQFNKVLMTTNQWLGGQAQQTDGMIGKLTSLASGYIGVSAAMQQVHGAMMKMRQEAEGSLELIKGRTGTMGELFQVAKGNTPEEVAADTDSMVKEAESASTKYGWNFGETLKVRREARNADADASFDKIMKYSHLTRDPETVAKAVGQFKFNFGNEDLGFEEIANTSLAASQGSPVDMKDIFTKLGSASAMAKNVGSTSDEFMSYYSVLAKGFGNANEAADTLGLLVNKGQMKGLGGKGIAGIVDQLKSMTPEERADTIGERESINKAINVLGTTEGQAALSNQSLAVAEAKRLSQSADSPLNVRNQALLGSREMQGTIKINRAEALADITKREVGIDEAERKTGRLLAQSQQRIAGGSPATRGYNTFVGDWLSPYLPASLAGPAEFAGGGIAAAFGMHTAGEASRTPRSADSEAEMQKQTKLLEEIRNEMKAGNAPKTNPTNARSAAQAQAHMASAGSG